MITCVFASLPKLQFRGRRTGRRPHYVVIFIEAFYPRRERGTKDVEFAGKLDQRSAQAATWHLANGLSWNELAKKIRAKHLDGSTDLYFNQHELGLAMGYSNAATSLAKDAKSMLVSAGKSPGEGNFKQGQN